MIELGISQAQSQFTKILNQSVIIIDKKSHLKKAVLIPYDEYMELLKQCTKKEDLENGDFSKFVGFLDNAFHTDDARYNEIIK